MGDKSLGAVDNIIIAISDSLSFEAGNIRPGIWFGQTKGHKSTREKSREKIDFILAKLLHCGLSRFLKLLLTAPNNCTFRYSHSGFTGGKPCP